MEGKSIQDAIHWCVHHEVLQDAPSHSEGRLHMVSLAMEIAVLQQPLSNDQECLESKKV